VFFGLTGEGLSYGGKGTVSESNLSPPFQNRLLLFPTFSHNFSCEANSLWFI